MEPGLHPNAERADYYRAKGANFSALKGFARTPAHAREAMIHPPEPTAAMELGTAVHLAVLEPDRFAEECAVAPKVDRRTKEGKATWAAFEVENAGKVLLREEDHAMCVAMRDAVWAHPIASQMLKGPGHAEVAVVWDHLDPAMRCKGLIDRIGQFDGWTWVIDLKSCQDASPWSFASTVARQFYHAQAAFYLDGCNAIAPRQRRFAWLAVEKEPPYAVAIHEPDGDMLERGRALYEGWLRDYAEAKAKDVWPGYPNEIRALSLPRWAQGGGTDGW